MTQTTKTLRVALNNYHNSQIVQPVVTATQTKYKADCTVTLKWFDGADRSYSTPKTFTGTRDEAERWLLAQGVRLDAQGIHE